MKKALFLAVFATAVLAGCGGRNDDDTPAATSQVPASASMSVEGLMTYLKALVASPADTLEPVDVSTVTPPVSETTEPEAVD